MSADQVDQIAEAVALKITRYKAPVLTREEAVAYVGKGSDRSFRRWCADYKVRPCSAGRYSRRSLEMGMNKESRGRA